MMPWNKAQATALVCTSAQPTTLLFACSCPRPQLVVVSDDWMGYKHEVEVQAAAAAAAATEPVAAAVEEAAPAAAPAEAAGGRGRWGGGWGLRAPGVQWSLFLFCLSAQHA